METSEAKIVDTTVYRFNYEKWDISYKNMMLDMVQFDKW